MSHDTAPDAPQNALHSDGVDFISHSTAQTRRAGAHLGRLLAAGDVVLLYGDLGAGKTTLTRGIAEGLDVHGYVNSPTFTLVNEYQGRVPVYHIDCYRIESVAEALDFGFEDYLDGSGVTLIEWPERLAPLLPPAYLRVTLRYISDTKRGFRLEPVGTAYAATATAFKHAVFGA